MKRSGKSILILILAMTIPSFVLLIQQSALLDTALAAEKKNIQYTCPMHPSFISDKPGDCPICGMRLVATGEHRDPNEICIIHNCPMMKEGKPCPMLIIAEKGEKLKCPVCGDEIRGEASAENPEAALPEGYASVWISPQKQQLIGIRTGIVERKNGVKTIRAAGRIAYDPDLYQAESEYIESYGSSTSARKTGEKSAGDWTTNLIESAKTKLIRIGLNSQMIEALQTQAGPDKSLLYAIPDGDAWVYANIYEYEIPLVKVGDELNVEVASASGKVLKGNIRAIDTVVDPATRTVRVRALVKNEGGMLKPDMYVTVSLETALGNVILVPEEAVFFAGKTNIVFVDKGQGLFEPRRLALGQKAGDSYVVNEGLADGEKVVTNGNFLVDSESKLKSALSRMGGHSHGS